MALPAFIFEHLMIVLVVGLAVAAGRDPAIIAAIAGGVGDNILLREPIGRPAITGVRDAVDLGLFLGVAIVVGWLVDRLRTAKDKAVSAAHGERLAREELDRLISTVTHDLATPLSAIQGTIQFARKHAALSEVDIVRLLVRVETAAARATSLVKALADAKSIEEHSFALRLRCLDFRGVVDPIVRMLDRLSERHPIAVAIDAEFRNSLAETLTESEQAFQLGFVAMSDQIIAAIFRIFAVSGGTLALQAACALAVALAAALVPAARAARVRIVDGLRAVG